jgi:hypothetical protein
MFQTRELGNSAVENFLLLGEDGITRIEDAKDFKQALYHDGVLSDNPVEVTHIGKGEYVVRFKPDKLGLWKLALIVEGYDTAWVMVVSIVDPSPVKVDYSITASLVKSPEIEHVEEALYLFECRDPKDEKLALEYVKRFYSTIKLVPDTHEYARLAKLVGGSKNLAEISKEIQRQLDLISTYFPKMIPEGKE